MKNNNKLFEFSSISRYHIIALLVPIFCMATTYIQKNELKKIINKENEIKEFPYFFNIFVSKILSIFLVIFSKFLNKENSSIKLLQTKSMRRYHLSVNNTKKKILVFLLILCISILEITFKYEGYHTIGLQNLIELKLGFLLLVPLFSIFILKKQIFKHHILSFCLCILGFILICCSTIFYDPKPSLYEQMRHLFFSIPLGLSFVILKYLYDNSFLDAFTFLFFDGILCIVIPFIIVGIKSFFKNDNYFIDNMKEFLLLFDSNIIIYFIFVVIFSFGYYLTNALTIYIFSPSLMVMTDILSPFFRWIIEIFIDKDWEQKEFIFIAFFKGMGFLIVIFSALIFNEVLILHFYDFDKNTENNIQKRANEELENSEKNISKYENDNNLNDSFESELSIF